MLVQSKGHPAEDVMMEPELCKQKLLPPVGPFVGGVVGKGNPVKHVPLSRKRSSPMWATYRFPTDDNYGPFNLTPFIPNSGSCYSLKKTLGIMQIVFRHSKPKSWLKNVTYQLLRKKVQKLLRKWSTISASNQWLQPPSYPEPIRGAAGPSWKRFLTRNLK